MNEGIMNNYKEPYARDFRAKFIYILIHVEYINKNICFKALILVILLQSHEKSKLYHTQCYILKHRKINNNINLYL